MYGQRGPVFTLGPNGGIIYLPIADQLLFSTAAAQTSSCFIFLPPYFSFMDSIINTMKSPRDLPNINHRPAQPKHKLVPASNGGSGSSKQLQDAKICTFPLDLQLDHRREIWLEGDSDTSSDV